MIDLPKPGAYVVRTAQANNFSKNLVLNWLGFPAISPMKACLWLTASPNNEVQSLLEPYLLKRADATKGLDVVSVRDMVQKGCPTNSIRQLCRSLNTLSILQPTLVILEHAELWFNNSQEPLK